MEELNLYADEAASSPTYPDEFNSFAEYRDTLTKEPAGAGALKEYHVGCYSNEDWNDIHTLLITVDTTENFIPSRMVDCFNEFQHSPVRGGYLLTDGEAAEIGNHEKVEYVNINQAAYPGNYLMDPAELQDISKESRYREPTQNCRVVQSQQTPVSPTLALRNRASCNLYRHTQPIDPWWTVGNDTAVITDRIPQFGTGKGVDIIVCDQDAWFGHIEFQNTLGISSITKGDDGVPQNYDGGNPLWTAGISTTVGTCDLCDLVLEAPYYLDPDFFNADPANRLELRWDGTTVPVESFARDWWQTNNTSNRSSKFVSPANGGTATGNDDFGTISVNAGYTRSNSNGSNTAQKTGTGFHGTPCASQAYGRQYGWAYNANKWYLNLYGSNSLGIENGFDMQKVFHQIKPINPTYGDKNPTMSSNSWGYRGYTSSSGYYYYRQGTTGTGGVYYTTRPNFMNNFTQSSIRAPFDSNSMLTAGNEAVSAGIIFCCSAGNTNQKLVKADHPDWNNYHHTSANLPLTSQWQTIGGMKAWKTINRQGFPGQIGAVGSSTNDTNTQYNTIACGCLDDNNNSSDNKERKVNYSAMGNLVDLYSVGDQTLSACDNRSVTRYNRYDAYYVLDGVQSTESEDRKFGGTSAATPIACGLIATKMEYNRNWGVQDVKTWLSSTVGIETSDYFYYGSESTTATGAYGDQHSIHDDNGPLVLWDALTGNEPISKLDMRGTGLRISNLPVGMSTIS